MYTIYPSLVYHIFSKSYVTACFTVRLPLTHSSLSLLHRWVHGTPQRHSIIFSLVRFSTSCYVAQLLRWSPQSLPLRTKQPVIQLLLFCRSVANPDQAACEIRFLSQVESTHDVQPELKYQEVLYARTEVDRQVAQDPLYSAVVGAVRHSSRCIAYVSAVQLHIAIQLQVLLRVLLRVFRKMPTISLAFCYASQVTTRASNPRKCFSEQLSGSFS